MQWTQKFASTLLLCIHVSFDTATLNLLKHLKEAGLSVQKRDSNSVSMPKKLTMMCRPFRS